MWHSFNCWNHSELPHFTQAALLLRVTAASCWKSNFPQCSVGVDQTPKGMSPNDKVVCSNPYITKLPLSKTLNFHLLSSIHFQWKKASAKWVYGTDTKAHTHTCHLQLKFNLSLRLKAIVLFLALNCIMFTKWCDPDVTFIWKKAIIR